jgi:hypothetical protein
MPKVSCYREIVFKYLMDDEKLITISIQLPYKGEHFIVCLGLARIIRKPGVILNHIRPVKSCF